ncbi:MAG: DUF3500 domain-containing protein [Saprospiraceae bacterium]|nr:DUF3500 domain-containing protein [Saprospiraceae bacterium]
MSSHSLMIAQNREQSRFERFKQMSQKAEESGLEEDFKGITTGGAVVPDLFKIRSTGVSTEPVRKAATKFLGLLTAEQLKKTKYDIDDSEWRKWMNQHFYIRQGINFAEMSKRQREAAFGLLKNSLSAKGLNLSKDIMKLNHTLGELNSNNFEEYGEWLYHVTVMGEPSKNEPWGWQIDGHHLIINYFILGDQVVMSPVFVGSEPVIATTGKYSGTAILQDEQNAGLNMLLTLNQEQKQQAILKSTKGTNNNLTEAFKDNVVLDYAGIKASNLSRQQKDQLTELIKMYIDYMDSGHAKIKMDEIKAHINDTYFAWIGGDTENSVYYYRIHSPVILIEFDHQKLVGIRHLYPDVKSPHRQHIHVVVRTPNGNDYGKDLLRQHYEMHPHGN